MTHIPAELVASLERDVTATLGESYRRWVRQAAVNVEGLDIVDGGAKLVDDVQQAFHDEFIDTTWPSCPRHHRHPLWYRDGGWWCEADGVFVARLGDLGQVSRPAG